MSRDELIRFGATGDARFIDLATLTLGAHPEDDELRLLLTRRLIEGGLLFRAAAVLRSFNREQLAQLEFQRLYDQLNVPTNNGLVAWSRFEAQFARNVDALQKKYSWVSQLRDVWNSRRNQVELHRTSDDRWQVFDLAAPPAGAWRPNFGNHLPSDSVEQLAPKLRGKILPPFVIDGIGLGYQLPMIFEATQGSPIDPSPILYQIEQDFAALAVVLHLHDLQQVIESPRVVLCIGSDAHNDFERELRERNWAPLPRTIYACAPWNRLEQPQAQQIVQSAVAAEVDRCAQLRAQAGAIYRDRNSEYWVGRFREGLESRQSPLRILAITSRFTTVLQYSTRDVIEALSSLGCETQLLIEPDVQSAVLPERVLRTIIDFKPDAIFMIDHTRQSQSASLIENVPVITWVQDRLHWLFNETAGRAMGPLDFCLGIGRYELVTKWHYPAERFLSCEMATSAGCMAAALDEDIVNSPYACDLAYATHASDPPEVFHATKRERCSSQPGRVFLDAIFEELKQMSERCELNGALHIDHFLERIEKSQGVEVSVENRLDLIGNYVRPLADRFLRHQTITWAAKWASQTGRRFNLYGNGWENHPRFGIHARGNLKHGPLLAQAFRAAKINLHAGCNHAFHQRVLDGLCAGGFFLIRRHGADTSYPLSKAMWDWIKRKNPVPPVEISHRDFSPPMDEVFKRHRRLNGHDPEAAMTLTAAHFEHMREIHEGDDIRLASQIWPGFEEITFENEPEFCQRVEYFMNQPEERVEIVEAMREQVLRRFSYRATMTKLLIWMIGCLERQVGMDARNVGRATASANTP